MENLKNRLKTARLVRGWSQDELARLSGVSRSGISAIEIERLVPSATAALRLAKVFECRVEDLFSLDDEDSSAPIWATSPQGSCRYWQAEVDGRLLAYPADTFGDITTAHDGVFDGTSMHPAEQFAAERTLVMACCDPAVGLLAEELARNANIRLLVLSRSSSQALELLRNRQVHVAGVHLSHAAEDGNAMAIEETLGRTAQYKLLRAARWEEGLAIAADCRMRSVRSVLSARLRWIGREPGSGAHQCLTEIRRDRTPPKHNAHSHRGVAETIRSGLADVGVCLRLVSEQAGLNFLSVREEAYDLCFAADQMHDSRIAALVEAIRSPGYRKLLSELPGYSAIDTGVVQSVGATSPTKPFSPSNS
jgi:molybdate-binding protein/DNA-binding XRE family transcriptional regulator